MTATTPELTIDLDLPARYPSRYRGTLVAVTRLEARVQFRFEPNVFRTGEVEACGAEIVLTVGRRSVRVQGDLEPDRGNCAARVAFDQPIALPDYSFLRKACGLEEDRPVESATASADEGSGNRPRLAGHGF